MKIELSTEEKERLEKQHKQERDGRVRDRIKAVLLSHKGWSMEQIAQALRIHLIGYMLKTPAGVLLASAFNAWLEEAKTDLLMALDPELKQLKERVEQAHKKVEMNEALLKQLRLLTSPLSEQ